MQKTPKGNRLHIGILGRTNVGKSSILNLFTGQDIAIVSDVAGTTTDIVEKAMELLPIGPVVFIDTAGLDDYSELGKLRVQKTMKVLDRADIVLLVVEADMWTDYEDMILEEVTKRNTPILTIINKVDLKEPTLDFIEKVKQFKGEYIKISAIDKNNRDKYLNELKNKIYRIVPEDFFRESTLAGDLVKPGGLAILVVPIDLQAPKGRLILPQVQTIRDILDNDAMVLVVKERELAYAISNLKDKPDIVITDSQAVLKVAADVPENIKMTTFSILFARYKGELNELVRGLAHLKFLKDGDKVLIAEACTHHPLQDDIGRVKIPRWLRQFTGADFMVDVYAGRDFPQNLNEYKVVIHCGGCTLNKKEMMSRIRIVNEHNVPMTNYGLCISYTQGVLERALSPFPSALMTFKKEIKKLQKVKDNE